MNELTKGPRPRPDRELDSRQFVFIGTALDLVPSIARPKVLLALELRRMRAWRHAAVAEEELKGKHTETYCSHPGQYGRSNQWPAAEFIPHGP